MTIPTEAQDHATSAAAKADELVRHERARHPTQVPYLFRCAALEPLEPWQRAKVAAEAAGEISQTPGIFTFNALWLAICLFLYLSLVPRFYQFAALPLVAVVATVVPLLVVSAITRRRIRDKVRAIQPLVSSANA